MDWVRHFYIKACAYLYTVKFCWETVSEKLDTIMIPDFEINQENWREMWTDIDNFIDKISVSIFCFI